MISILIPTLDEDKNILYALESARLLSDDIVVLDSGSRDGTFQIVDSFSKGNMEICVRFIVHPFEGYGKQWNWAIENIEFQHQWLFLLAADERVSPELADHAKANVSNNPPEEIVAFYIKRKLIWMGRWIKHGGVYPFWDARLFKKGKARYDSRGVNEHLILNGVGRFIEGDIIHLDMRGTLEHWLIKHMRYAELEANALFADRDKSDLLKPQLFGSQAQRKRWIRKHVWESLPPLIRPFIYFTYRYFLRLGILDGKEGLIYHFLQGLWFPMLIDIKYLERKVITLKKDDGIKRG